MHVRQRFLGEKIAILARIFHRKLKYVVYTLPRSSHVTSDITKCKGNSMQKLLDLVDVFRCEEEFLDKIHNASTKCRINSTNCLENGNFSI